MSDTVSIPVKGHYPKMENKFCFVYILPKYIISFTHTAKDTVLEQVYSRILSLTPVCTDYRLYFF